MSANPFDVAIDAFQTRLKRGDFQLSSLTIAVTLLALLLPFILLLVLALSQREEPLPPPDGCRKLGKEGPSNLTDQFLKKYSKGAAPSSTNPWKVKALFVYPIKSCKGIELEQAEVVNTGLKYDRQFAFAQLVTSLPTLEGKVTSEWTFITQRTFPRLAKVETEIWYPEANAHGNLPGKWAESEGCLVVRFPFTPDVDFSLDGLRAYGKILATRLAGRSEPMVEFRIPFNPTKERCRGYKREKMNIWKDSPIAMNISSEVPEEVIARLRYTLGVANPLALFRIDAARYREVHKCAPKKKDVGFQPIIGMQDSYPMHIMNLSSVQHVSSRLPRGSAPLSALRFRPNVLLTGPPAFDEDDWRKARIGGNMYDISCRTTRCKLPNVDPETGIADRNEPGVTMRQYRIIDKGSNSACLGMQVTPLSVGHIAVHDDVAVLERGEHFYLKA